jgi:ABC-2 type transport system ATP-binding protein
MNPYVIETDNLSLHYGQKTALDRLTLQIPRGGIHAFIGANGAGKSSLFRLLLGFEVPSEGTARVLGHDSTALTPSVRARIGFVNEEHTLPEWMRVDELTRMQRKQYPKWNQKRYDEVLRNFNVQERQKVSELSRGERAGVSLALALGQNPELLVLDEPTLGLDMVAKRTLLESLLYTDGDKESTIIYCSHQMEEIERIADNLVIIERGRLRHMSEPDALCNRVRLWAAQFPTEVDTRALTGILEMQQFDGISHLMMLDAPASFDTLLASMGARNITSSAVPLGRAVSGMLAAGHISQDKKNTRNHYA